LGYWLWNKRHLENRLQPTISVIIVTWNGLGLLKQFLPSVVKYSSPNVEILIADNASEDGSKEWVERNWPACKVVRFHENFGYCGGNNRAAQLAAGELLVFLNNDVQVASNWLDPLVAELSDPSVGAVQPKILSFHNPEWFEYAGAAGGYLDQLGYPFCRGRVFDTLEKDHGQYDDATDIFWASGAALAIRKDLFLEQNGFDESFRFHMEEVDLCWRLQNNGYRVRCRPDSTVYHRGASSLTKDDPRKTYFNFRNSLIMIWKNASTSWLKRNFLFRLIMDGAAGFHALLKGNLRDTFAIFRSHLNFYLHWRVTHRERVRLQSKRISKEPITMLPVSVVGEYFFSGRQTYSEIISWLEKRSERMNERK